MAVHPENSDWLLVGAWSGSNNGEGIFLSTDGGDNWAPTIGLSTHEELKVPDIVFDPLDHNIVYAATHGGLRVSINGGLTWQKYPGAMGQVPITSLAATIDGDMTRLYIGAVGGKISEVSTMYIQSQEETIISAGIYVGLSDLVFDEFNFIFLPLIIR